MASGVGSHETTVWVAPCGSLVENQWKPNENRVDPVDHQWRIPATLGGGALYEFLYRPRQVRSSCRCPRSDHVSSVGPPQTHGVQSVLWVWGRLYDCSVFSRLFDLVVIFALWR